MRNSWKSSSGDYPEDKASSVRVPVANFTLQSSVQLLRENTDSVRSNQWMGPTAPSVPLKLKENVWDLRLPKMDTLTSIRLIRFLEDLFTSQWSRLLTLVVDQIVPAFLKELIYKVLGLLVSLLELNRFRILLGESEEGRDMRLSWVLLQSPQMIKVSPPMGMWTTFPSLIILA
nr:hypothetical protein [Tanacetum cinerariifolium]